MQSTHTWLARTVNVYRGFAEDPYHLDDDSHKGGNKAQARWLDEGSNPPRSIVPAVDRNVNTGNTGYGVGMRLLTSVYARTARGSIECP